MEISALLVIDVSEGFEETADPFVKEGELERCMGLQK